MLDAMAFPEDIYADSFIYLRVIFLGIPATVAYNTQAGLMRAMATAALRSSFLSARPSQT